MTEAWKPHIVVLCMSMYLGWSGKPGRIVLATLILTAAFGRLLWMAVHP